MSCEKTAAGYANETAYKRNLEDVIEIVGAFIDDLEFEKLDMETLTHLDGLLDIGKDYVKIAKRTIRFANDLKANEDFSDNREVRTFREYTHMKKHLADFVEEHSEVITAYEKEIEEE